MSDTERTDKPLEEILGRRSYEADLGRRTVYENGERRPTWDELEPYLQKTWWRAVRPGDPEYGEFIRDLHSRLGLS